MPHFSIEIDIDYHDEPLPTLGEYLDTLAATILHLQYYLLHDSGHKEHLSHDDPVFYDDTVKNYDPSERNWPPSTQHRRSI